MTAPLIIKRPFYDSELHFYPTSHKYRWKGEWVPGVTGILGRTIPKEALIQWAADQAVDYIERELPALGSADLSRVLTEARKAHVRTKEQAGDEGTIAHEYCEHVLGQTGRVVKLPDNPKIVAAINAFEQWRTSTPHKPLEIERLVFSAKLFYAGKCDFRGLINDRPALLDFKTGNGVYKEALYQMAGYEMALQEELGLADHERFDWYVIHLNKRTGECKPYSCLANSETHDRARRVWQRCVEQDRDIKFIPELMPRRRAA